MSEETAVANLKQYFGDNTADYISIEELFRNAGRGSYPKQANRTWSHGKFSSMKPHGLFWTVKQTVNGKYVTVGIRLTPKGKEALRHLPAHLDKKLSYSVNNPETEEKLKTVDNSVSHTDIVTVDDILSLIEKYNSQSGAYILEASSLNLKRRGGDM